MMKKQLMVVSFLALAVFMLLVNACTPKLEEEAVECNSPYIQVGKECCLDENKDGFCDELLGQSTVEIEEVKETEKQQAEPQRIKATEKLSLKSEELPMKVYMQRKTRILYTIESEGETKEEVFIIDELNRFQITIHYSNDRYKIDVGETIPIGPLLIKFIGVDPPEGGNFAVLEFFEAA